MCAIEARPKRPCRQIVKVTPCCEMATIFTNPISASRFVNPALTFVNIFSQILIEP